MKKFRDCYKLLKEIKLGTKTEFSELIHVLVLLSKFVVMTGNVTNQLFYTDNLSLVNRDIIETY